MALAPNALLFGLSILAFGTVTILATGEVRLPGNQQGYAPVQPIAYSHRLHAGELGIDCLYCHYGGRFSRHAGIPPATLCMNCHNTVTAGFDALQVEKERAEQEGREPALVVSAELRKLYDALALDERLEPIRGQEPRPVEWVRVHNVPDFIYFDHRPHVARGLACQVCHGPVQAMERVRREHRLNMGWCLDCHRSTPQDPSRRQPFAPDQPLRERQHVSTDCVSCHL